MIATLKVLGYTLRASALICILWIIGQVVTAQITTLPALLQSLAFHATFALSGTALVGQARRMSAPVAVAPIEQ